MVEKSQLRKGGKDMQKVIKIERGTVDETSVYLFKLSDSLIFSVSCKEKKIEGKLLFEKIYSDYSPDNRFNVLVDIDSLDAQDKKEFGKYVVDLFKKIDEALNKQFPLIS